MISVLIDLFGFAAGVTGMAGLRADFRFAFGRIGFAKRGHGGRRRMRSGLIGAADDEAELDEEELDFQGIAMGEGVGLLFGERSVSEGVEEHRVESEGHAKGVEQLLRSANPVQETEGLPVALFWVPRWT